MPACKCLYIRPGAERERESEKESSEEEGKKERIGDGGSIGGEHWGCMHVCAREMSARGAIVDFAPCFKPAALFSCMLRFVSPWAHQPAMACGELGSLPVSIFQSRRVMSGLPRVDTPMLALTDEEGGVENSCRVSVTGRQVSPSPLSLSCPLTYRLLSRFLLLYLHTFAPP